LIHEVLDREAYRAGDNLYTPKEHPLLQGDKL
jgi:hypothetical protein